MVDMLLYFIIFITFIVILLVNFTVELIKDRNFFKKSGVSEDLFLAENFFNKYNKHPINHKRETLFHYNPLRPLDNIIIDNNKKIFIINSYISLINGIFLNNNYLININPLIHRDILEDQESSKKKSKKSKENGQRNNINIREIDWHKIIWNKNHKSIKLERIINYFFFSMDNDCIGLHIDQEYTIDGKKELIATHLKINLKYLIIMEINGQIINKEPTQEKYMGIDIDLKNLNIIATVFAIINCIESNNFNLIMIKNIKSSLYSPLINYYSSKGSVEFIKSISIMDLFDNVKRCTIQLILKQKDKHTEIEEYFDFDCPQYSFPELVMIYN